MVDDIEIRLRQAHGAAQDALAKARSVTGEALVSFANVGRIIDEGGWSPEQIAAIDPEIERSRIHYHAAKRHVAAHPDQLEMPALKLLLPPADTADKAGQAAARDEMIELQRIGANLAKQLERVAKTYPTLTESQVFIITQTLKPALTLCEKLKGIPA